MSECPEWVDDPDTCDRDDCDGKVWYTVEGDRFSPVAQYHSTCGHVDKRVGQNQGLRGGRP